MESMQSFVLGMAPSERAQVIDLLKDELARGWIPKQADLEAALATVRGEGRALP
ncbi:hypothetical protein GCM10023350_08750 [Nocardioides endophyticus]|uniref:Antitoxin VbhA domain-containing protein n=1 Tax=Nocardioides endophyticus TaxID=1353775 RepID=A0ABP8YH79_9ACTN